MSRVPWHVETRREGVTFSTSIAFMQKRKGQWAGWLCAMARTEKDLLRVVEARKLADGQLLLVTTNIAAPTKALDLHRKRWAIECLFANAKTRGFNIEDTHMNDPGKLSTVLSIVAMAWAYRCLSRIEGQGDTVKNPWAG